MQKTLLKSALSLLAIIFISGCVATQEEFRSLNLKLRNQDNRLVELEQQTSAGTNATGSVQKKLADLAQEIEAMSTELLQLKGQLEETNHRNRTLQDDNQELRALLNERLAELAQSNTTLKSQVSGLTDNLSSVQTALEAEANRRAEEALKSAELARQKAAAAAEAKRQAEEAQRRAAAAAKLKAKHQAKGNTIREIKPRLTKQKKTHQTSTTTITKQTTTPPAVSKNEAEATYDSALSQYRSKEYKQAITTFSSFLDKYPKDKLAPNARYWLGASMLQSGDYSGAVLEFQNIVDGYPSHPKAPEALLQQAKAFAHFGEKAVQIKLYKDVLAYYPDSEQAKKAKKMLRKLQ